MGDVEEGVWGRRRRGREWTSPLTRGYTGPMRQLFIDLDGVLADFDGFYFSTFGQRLDRNTVDPPGMWDNIDGYDRFYASLPPMEGAAHFWGAVRMLHPNPIILTGIARKPGCAEEKREWVARHIDPTAEVITCLSKEKRNHGKPGDVLVDDWHKYQHLWEEMGGIFILHQSPAVSLLRLQSIFRII